MSANNIFCSDCGAKAVTIIPATGTVAPHISRTSVPEIAPRTNPNSLDTGSSLALFIVNPIGAMQLTFEKLGPQKAPLVGILFALISEFCLIFGLLRLADTLAALIGSYFGYDAGDSVPQIDLTKPALVGFLPFIALSITLFLARLIFREKGASLKNALAGDTFVAGAALLPLGFFVLLSSFLGVGNVELIAALFLFAICYTILILFAGLTRIAKVADFGAAFAVPTVILSSAYLLKVVISALYDAGALN